MKATAPTTDLPIHRVFKVRFPFPVKQIGDSEVTIELPLEHAPMFTESLERTTADFIGEKEAAILFDELANKYHQLLLSKSLIIT